MGACGSTLCSSLCSDTSPAPLPQTWDDSQLRPLGATGPAYGGRSRPAYSAAPGPAYSSSGPTYTPSKNIPGAVKASGGTDSLAGVLSVRVCEARGLKRADWLTAGDYFATCSFASFSARTKTKTVFFPSPEWNEVFRIAVLNKQLGFGVKLSVYDRDMTLTNDFIGTVTVPLASIMNTTLLEQWLPLSSSSVEGQGEPVGELRIRAQFLPKAAVEGQFWKSICSAFDVDKDSHISRLELATLFQAVGYTLTEQEFAKIFNQLDVNKDGKLSTDEISRMRSIISSDGSNKVIRFLKCPICKRDLRQADDTASICHVGMCLDDKDGIDAFTCATFTTEENAASGFVSRLMGDATFGKYQVSGDHILVQDRATGRIMEEKIPAYVKIPLVAMYNTKAGLSAAEGDEVKKLLRKMTEDQKAKFDDPKSAKGIPDFIRLHDLNTREILLPLDKFENFNQFFYRKLRPDARPISPSPAVCAADSRCLVFPTIDDATRLWIKGRRFSVKGLLFDDRLGDYFAGGSIVIFRLSPQDYHRFHSPVDGTLGSPTEIGGEYYTVNPLAVRKQLDVFTENKRCRVMIDSPRFGMVAFVAVGATMVGSINMTASSSSIRRGEELGYFAFGGSTCIAVFRKGAIAFDHDLVTNSMQPLETLVQVGQSLGQSR